MIVPTMSKQNKLSLSFLWVPGVTTGQSQKNTNSSNQGHAMEESEKCVARNIQHTRRHTHINHHGHPTHPNIQTQVTG